MLKSFIEIKLEICSIYKAQYAEENNPLKFTELFQETRDTSTTQGLEVTLQNNPVECLLRSYRCAAYWKYVRDLEPPTTQTARLQHSRIPVRSIRVVSLPVEILQNSVGYFPYIFEHTIQLRQFLLLSNCPLYPLVLN